MSRRLISVRRGDQVLGQDDEGEYVTGNFQYLREGNRRGCGRTRSYLGYAAALVLALPLIAGAQPAAAKYASLIMDAETGRILHQTNAYTRNYPASLTKMMTIYMVFDALESGVWKLNKRLRISRRAARQPASRLGLTPGQSISVKQAILALVTRSANDVATVIAENMSGSERSFALHMTAKARKLGMSRTTFRNASGLPHRGQMSTARDMARLARALVRNHSRHYHFFSTTQFKYGGRVHRNHNKLLVSYEGTDGIKTGYIRASGYNLVASVKRGGQRLIGVVFGGNSSKQRNRHMTSLLNKGFRLLGKGTVITKKTTTNKKKTIKQVSKRAGPAPGWGVQVGAFARYNQAYDVARAAMILAPSLLRDGHIKVVPLTKKSGRVLHRARIYGISKRQAYLTCGFLKKHKKHCMEVHTKKGFQVASNTR